jgi:hypothetical protein
MDNHVTLILGAIVDADGWIRRVGSWLDLNNGLGRRIRVAALKCVVGLSSVAVTITGLLTRADRIARVKTAGRLVRDSLRVRQLPNLALVSAATFGCVWCPGNGSGIQVWVKLHGLSRNVCLFLN